MRDFAVDPIRISVADPHPLVLAGYQRFFDLDDATTMVAGCTSLLLLERSLLQADPPHVAIVDWNLVPNDSVSLADLIRSTAGRTKLLIVAARSEAPGIQSALMLGAKGILRKHATASEIISAVKKVARGGLWVDKGAAEAVLQLTYGQRTAERDGESRLRRLTGRERQILLCVSNGMRNKAIASELNIAETTVAHHLSSIFSKLQVEDRYGLISFSHWHQLAIRTHCEPLS